MSRSAPLNLAAFGFAASAALVVLFVLCWIVAAVMPGLAGASHGWVALFTTAPVGSVRALVEGRNLEHRFWLDNRSRDGANLQSDCGGLSSLRQ